MTSNDALFTKIIEKELISTLFQPVFDFSKTNALGYEALSRGPQGSALESPEVLFKLAGQLNKISELELLCRKKAIINFANLNLSGKLLLNVSPNVLLDPNHPRGETLHLLAQNGLSANRVIIEVTEQEKVEDNDLFKQTIQHYRELGFVIAIDDLGAGYSGLKQWSELQPDIVKIDRYFIDHCDQSFVKKAFLKMILELAKITNTQVIAEGIEREEELLLLKSLGINLMQGFLLQRPVKIPNKNSLYYPSISKFKLEQTA
ncbi:EAL domain, c-di-GMP-specific phosphodiesterase class I (or its enzymatically inactive variant) [Pseudoalteromonas denitrificans DSM 6059]|uniref:EAL domain, c-di-GMP-specific phosphodiesterase class I (Or its enzymatically inactive variant) n=1 Tax=Pseudoalteromonas denitrificans DSM 6059 TaxID=1123010 RepID=A0A1I1DW77_9GAMM|nr:EAL domain, c-di-GMP-specific phosphodiesterase class I (or its enzymatically inactive variant) [Pseudoalteromonas denitrificans DSM 6059]